MVLIIDLLSFVSVAPYSLHMKVLPVPSTVPNFPQPTKIKTKHYILDILAHYLIKEFRHIKKSLMLIIHKFPFVKEAAKKFLH